MKKYALLIFAAIAFVSCEDIQDNSPGLQSEINDVFFRALDARATQNDDGSYVIQGYTQDEILTLRVSAPSAGVYEVGGDSKNFASFEDALGNFHVTSPNGGGQIEIPEGGWDTSDKTLSGTFTFNTITPGIDTLTVHSGVFYRVPYGFGLNEPIQSPPPNGNAGTFVASVDNSDFNPITVTAVHVENSIIITAETATVTIWLRIPINADIGSYSLPRPGFKARYIDINGTEEAIGGNIIVIGNDPLARKIKGTFSFETDNHKVNIGQFNVIYE